ncbi:MAG: bifunctional demethylmenaquinone methyltransferase/2-methoxy-6-polyprenyl-1,4-benzoquinol methylase UbiE [Candidatus Abyssubacteria bacterium]
MKDAARIRSMFASISRRYDLLNHLLSFNRDTRWRKRAVALSGVGPGARVLDVCTGTADLALAYAECVGPDGYVVGADFCPEMLEIGTRKLGSLNGSGQIAGKVALLVADTLRIPFPDATFDVVSVAFGIRNVSDYRAGICEMVRVAKPGGRVVILEFSLPENRLFGGLYKFYFTRLLPVVGKAISGARNDAYSYLPDSVLKFPEGEEMCAMLRQCGLENVSAQRMSMGIVTLYVGRKSYSES